MRKICYLSYRPPFPQMSQKVPHGYAPLNEHSVLEFVDRIPPRCANFSVPIALIGRLKRLVTVT
jgi:hypothetical protein